MSSPGTDNHDNVVDLSAVARAHDQKVRGRSRRDSRRRFQRRAEPVMFRIGIELAGTPVFRVVEIRSDATLDVVHDVIQVTMGWTNSHLHQFSAGSDQYLMQYLVDEGDTDGVPEVEVRLDEVLEDAGDVLQYAYDFGDGWDHTLTVETVLPVGSAVAVCVDGTSACPPEDCGGVPGYQRLLKAVADPAAADQELLSWLGDWRPDVFEVSAVNRELERWATLPDGLNSLADPGFGLPEPVAELIRRVRDAEVQRNLVELARGNVWDDEPQIEEAVAAAMVRPFQWMLDRVGPDGLVSTPSGYLKPLDVLACATELDFDTFGKLNRENQTPQVHGLRIACQRLGLIRKLHGRFVRTVAGTKVADNPILLWRHIAAKIVSGDKAAQDAGRIVLLLTASGAPVTRESVHEPLAALGWGYSPTAPINVSEAYSLARPTIDALRLLGAMPQLRRDGEAAHHEGGVMFARTGLRR